MAQESKKTRTNINLVGSSSTATSVPGKSRRVKKVVAKSRRRVPASPAKIQRKTSRTRR